MTTDPITRIIEQIDGEEPFNPAEFKDEFGMPAYRAKYNPVVHQDDVGDRLPPTWAVWLIIASALLLCALAGIAAARGLIWLMGEPLMRYAVCAILLAGVFGVWRVVR